MAENQRLHFLSQSITYFKQEDVPFVSWPTRTYASELVMMMRGPDYDPGVELFMREAQKYDLIRYDYMEILEGYPVEKMLLNIDRLTEKEAEALITYYIRGERFSDGFFAHAIQSGMILKLVRHLRDLSINRQ